MCILKAVCVFCVHTGGTTRNRLPTLSETLTGPALQLKPNGSLIRVSADWRAPERDGVHTGAGHVSQHDDQTRKSLNETPGKQS